MTRTADIAVRDALSLRWLTLALVAAGCGGGEEDTVDGGPRPLCGYLAAADTFTCNWNGLLSDPPPPALCDENGVCCNGVAEECTNAGRHVCCDPRSGKLTYRCQGDGGIVIEEAQCEAPPDAGPPPCGYIADLDTYACGTRNDPFPPGRVCYSHTRCCAGDLGDCSKGEIEVCCDTVARELRLTCRDGPYLNWERIACE